MQTVVASESYKDFVTNLQNLLSMGVGLLVFATLVTLLGSLGGEAKLEGRMKAVAVRRESHFAFQTLAHSMPGPIRSGLASLSRVIAAARIPLINSPGDSGGIS